MQRKAPEALKFAQSTGTATFIYPGNCSGTHIHTLWIVLWTTSEEAQDEQP